MDGSTGENLIVDCELSDSLKCAICKEYYRDPHSDSHCGHVFCRKCIDEHASKGNKKCPVCRVDYFGARHWVPCFHLRTILSKMQRTCDACKVEYRGEYSSHLQSCASATVCPNCGIRVSPLETLNHSNTCEGPLTACVGCGQQLRERPLKAHLPKCSKVLQCCNEYYSISDQNLFEHRKSSSTCPQRLLPCQYGCGEYVPNRNYVRVLGNDVLFGERSHQKDCARQWLCAACSKYIPVPPDGQPHPRDQHFDSCEFVEVRCELCPESCFIKRKNMAGHRRVFHDETRPIAITQITLRKTVCNEGEWYELAGLNDTLMYLFAAFGSKCSRTDLKFNVSVSKESWKEVDYEESGNKQLQTPISSEDDGLNLVRIEDAEVVLKPSIVLHPEKGAPLLRLQATSSINPGFWLEGAVSSQGGNRSIDEFTLRDVRTSYAQGGIVQWGTDVEVHLEIATENSISNLEPLRECRLLCPSLGK